MSSNIFGVYFEQFGGFDNAEVKHWKLIDLMTGHFPEAVQRIIKAGNDEEGRRIMLDQLFPLIDQSPDLDETQKDDCCRLLENLAEANVPDPTVEVGAQE